MLIAPSESLLELIHNIVIMIEGVHGHMNKGMVKGSIDYAMTYVYGFEPFSEIIAKAAAMMWAIIVFHPFVDGNKRTALLGTYHFLWFNGYKFNIPNNSVEFTTEIAEFKKNIQEIKVWINKNSRRNLKAIWSNFIISVSGKLWPRHYILALLCLRLSFGVPTPEYLRSR